MAENLRVALAVVIVIGGWALIAYAGYLHYAALPEEHAPRHVATRAVVAGAGVCLLVLGLALVT